MGNENKQGICSLKLEKVEKSLNSTNGDFTIKKCTFSVLDFNISGNRQIVDEEEIIKVKDTLLNKPLLCKYIPSDNYDYENPNDDFDGHCETEIILRDGTEYQSTGTYAIGVCTDSYIGKVKDENGNDIECLLADFTLWFDRFPNEIMLINDFYEKGEELYSSVEYYFTKSEKVDGIEKVSDICFSGLCLLGSRTNKVEPSYTTSKLKSFNSKWNKALNSLKSNNLDLNKKNVNNKEENNTMENLFLNAMKSNNQLSFGDIRDAIYDKLSEIMTAKEYWNVWISNYGVFDTYFVYETYEDESYINYKVNYTNINDVVTIDLEGKEKVTYKCDLVPVTEVESSINAKKELKTTKEQLISANNKISTLEGEVKSLNSKIIEKSNNAKEDTEKFNELTEKLVSLNSMVETMKPIVEKYTSEVFEKSLNSAISNYEKTFTGINAMDVFNEDSTQELIKQSINSNKEISEKAIHSLNSLIVNNIKSVKKTDIDEVFLGEANISINELVKAKNNEDLIPKEDDILKEYGLNY
ncbi:hypothetical protein [Clostridium botulinum]|uniref:hypothetical protein n=1 Tax=Clostridium botulinum TaxID=1491 RepID=UPI001C9BBCB5|nr:hypothetical protein [Clostridium botulinum]MBY6838832.1 hypothetical protein [Clostridium botulinum]